MNSTRNEFYDTSLIIPNSKLIHGSNIESVVNTSSTEEKVKLLIMRDLSRLGWKMDCSDKAIQLSPPISYNKEIIKETMSFKRSEILNKNKDWIKKYADIAIDNLANGLDVLNSKFIPRIEVCETPAQHRLFRLLRYYWSSPYSEYVGRRIKLIIRDYGLPNKPVIGIVALGSPIIHIPERDEFIGWDKTTRTNNLNYMMDAYVIGALPPYNYLLGGKLVSYILASSEVRKIFEDKYKGSNYPHLAGIFTTGLYGRSSQYNRLKFKDNLLFKPIGFTKGFGSLHLTIETIESMKDFLLEKDIMVSNKFGAGPSSTMRLIRAAGNELGFNSDHLLNHSFQRSIYFMPHAKNTIEFLNGRASKLQYNNYKSSQLVRFWKNRWLINRMKNERVLEQVKWTFASDYYDKLHLDV